MKKMRAIALAILLAAFTLVPKKEVDELSAEDRSRINWVFSVILAAFIICFLAGI